MQDRLIRCIILLFLIATNTLNFVGIVYKTLLPRKRYRIVLWGRNFLRQNRNNAINGTKLVMDCCQNFNLERREKRYKTEMSSPSPVPCVFFYPPPPPTWGVYRGVFQGLSREIFRSDEDCTETGQLIVRDD